MARTRRVQSYSHREEAKRKRLTAQCAELSLDTSGTSYTLSRRLEVHEQRQRRPLNAKDEPTLSNPASLWGASRKSAPSSDAATKKRKQREKAAEADSSESEGTTSDENRYFSVSSSEKETEARATSNDGTNRKLPCSPSPTTSETGKHPTKKPRVEAEKEVAKSKPRKAWTGAARMQASN